MFVVTEHPKVKTQPYLIVATYMSEDVSTNLFSGQFKLANSIFFCPQSILSFRAIELTSHTVRPMIFLPLCLYIILNKMAILSVLLSVSQIIYLFNRNLQNIVTQNNNRIYFKLDNTLIHRKNIITNLFTHIFGYQTSQIIDRFLIDSSYYLYE